MAHKLMITGTSLAIAGLCATFGFGLLKSTAARADVNAGMRADYDFETSPFMLHTAYRNIEKLDREDAPDGAYNPLNRKWDESHDGKWYIEQQRFGGDLVDGGVATGNTDAITRGLRIIQWGLDREDPDGGFSCPDRYHSTAFFVEATSHALLMIEASPFAGQYAAQIQPMIDKIHRAGQWMANPRNIDEARGTEAPYTHRRYMDAAAIGEAGVLANDQQLVDASRPFIEDGLSMQDPSGFNPEKGGYDSSYNTLGTYYALRYYNICASGELKPRMYTMLKNALAWEATRVNPDGTVSTDGNTRVNPNGGGEVARGTGGEKTVAVGQVFRSFYNWSRISGDTNSAHIAVQVAQGNHMADSQVPSF